MNSYRKRTAIERLQTQCYSLILNPIIFCRFLSLIVLFSQLLYLTPYHFVFPSCAILFCALTAFNFRFRQSASPRTRITAITTRTKNTDSGIHVFPKSPLQSTASCISRDSRWQRDIDQRFGLVVTRNVQTGLIDKGRQRKMEAGSEDN